MIEPTMRRATTLKAKVEVRTKVITMTALNEQGLLKVSV